MQFRRRRQEAVPASDRRVRSVLERFVDLSSGRVLVLHDPSIDSPVVDGDALVQETGLPIRDDRKRWPAVAVVVPDIAALRRIVSTQSRIGRTKSIFVWLTEASSPVLLTARPEWPAIVAAEAAVHNAGSTTAVLFERPVSANWVLEQMARDAVPGREPTNKGLFLASDSFAAPADPSTLRFGAPTEAADPELQNPPDVVLTDHDLAMPVASVTARAPVVVRLEALPFWPVDERVINPTGFTRASSEAVFELKLGAQGHVVLHGLDEEIGVDPRRGITPGIVAGLRDARAVRLVWPDVPQTDWMHAVASLACAGVPLIPSTVPDHSRVDLGTLTQLIESPVDYDDELAREERSVELRRIALREWSTHAWRGFLAKQSGLPFRSFPTVSVVLATRRPERLEFALRQFARQRGVDVELVLVAHGHEPDRLLVDESLAGKPATVLSVPEDVLFGEVLNRGVETASGQLIMKMDDDDWYGPDFLGDLLLARHYSGADLVGTTVEYVYLEMLDRTVRRIDDCERFVKFVAGGSIVADKSLIREVGGFRQARKHVDASLLMSINAAGGTIYRSHGLGYVLRRSAAGHTWDPGVEYYLDARRLGQSWTGFVPSRLLMPAAPDLPGAPDL